MKNTLFLILLFVSACATDQEPSASQQQDIAPPPSIQQSDKAGVIIELTERQVLELQINTVEVLLEKAAFEIALPGEVHPSPEHYAEVSAPISGRIVHIGAHEGESVQKGSVLLQLESLNFANLVAGYLEAQAEATFQQSELSRLTQLVDKGISPRRVLEKASSELSRAETRLSASFARLRVVGVSEETMATWSSSSRGRRLLPVLAPLSGIIDKHMIEMGTAVAENSALLTLIDPSQVLVKGFASPEDAGSLNAGDEVLIRTRQASNEQLSARISTINPAVDADNRSVILNIHAKTVNGWPRPGESVRLSILAESNQPVLAVPTSAIQYDGERAVVFVALSSSRFEQRAVTVLRMNEETAFIAEGLENGESVAVNQVFTLKALSRFDIYGE